MKLRLGARKALSCLLVLSGLSACSHLPGAQPLSEGQVNNTAMQEVPGSNVNGTNDTPGLGFIIGKGAVNRQQGTGIQVNAYLWRATLDTLSFMPLTSADPFGGVIITDWYSPPATPSERFKANAYILSQQMNANAIQVTLFHQVLQNGQWVDAAVDPNTVSGLEDRILSRAADLRAAAENTTD